MTAATSSWQERFSITWQKLTETLGRVFSTKDAKPSLDTRKILLFGGGGLLTIALLISCWLWVQDRDYQPLYGRHELYDSGAVMEVLEQQGIHYRLHPESGQILVRSSDTTRARMELATAGIILPVRSPASKSDKNSPLGISHFQERTRYLQGIEEDLAITIHGLDAVRRARVHLAVPESSTFLRDTPPARASVSLELYQGETLSRARVRGVIELVAGSVVGLDSQNVVVIDQSGNLLSMDVNELDKQVSAISQQVQIQSQVEHRLEQQVSKLVEALTGPGNYRVDVAVEMDFSNQEQAKEDYGPDDGVLRSESSRQTGVESADDTQQTTGEKNSAAQQQFIKNYEVNRTISRIKAAPGQLVRLSVAVLLNHRSIDNGKSAPWSEQELTGLRTLIQQAVGYKESRSDKVTVNSMSFFPATSCG